MKIKPQTANRRHNPKAQGFTLIEMIGVLAVIAILAAVLIPKVFEAINSARINNAAMTCNTVKTAITDHYAKFGSIMSASGTVIPNFGVVEATHFDRTLLSEGFLDKPFDVKISTPTGGVTNHVELAQAMLAYDAPTANNSAYNLDGTSSGTNNVNEAVGSVVVQAVIPGVTEADAKDLNDRLDGPALGTPLLTSDLVGRVKYATGSPTTVYVYITHR